MCVWHVFIKLLTYLLTYLVLHCLSQDDFIIYTDQIKSSNVYFQA